MADRTPAQLYALLVGAVLVVAGLLGFAADASFGNLGSNVEGDKLIVFEVNGWHNLVHLGSGAFLLAFAGAPNGARSAVLAFGVIYLVVTIYGFATGDNVLGLLPVNAADNVLHLVLGIVAIAAALAPGERERRTVATERR